MSWVVSYVLPGKSIRLRPHDALPLLFLAVCLPEVHHTQLHMLPVEPLSASHLKALHDGMHVDVMPGRQDSLFDVLAKHDLHQKKPNW